MQVRQTFNDINSILIRDASGLLNFIFQIPSAFSTITLERTVKDEVHDKSIPSESINQHPEDEEDVTDRDTSNSYINAALSSVDEVNEGDERPVNSGEPEGKKERLNIVYTLFWAYLSTCLCTATFLWADLIPGFGLVTKPSLLGKQ